MAKHPRKAAAAEVGRFIARSNELHARYLGGTRDLEQYERFTQWLADYLTPFAAELRVREEYAGAVDFVINELAGTNVVERDRQLARAAPIITAMLPLRLLRTMAEAARLNARTLEISLGICHLLQVDGKLPDTISEHAYFAASREVGSYDESIQLLETSIALGKSLESTVQNRWVGMTLKLMSGPAHAAGYGALQDFLENGYRTFRRIPEVDDFLSEVRKVMTNIFDRVFNSPLCGV